MRIGISTWTRRLAGGVETYLSALVPALLERGHDVAILHEVDDPVDRAPLAITTAVPHWCAAEGRDRALADLRAWRPDVIFLQGLEDPSLEASVAAIAPAVLFAHAYRGTCISGTKSFATLGQTACDRRLGWECLLRYYPLRCGGLNPATMMSLYRRESLRRDMLGQYASVVAFSEHIEHEYIRHGVAPDRIFRLPCHVPVTPAAAPVRVRFGALPSRILFVGRMEFLKGGHVLLHALRDVRDTLQRPLHVSFVGDGRLRTEWQAQASRVFPPDGTTRVEFTGWVGSDERDRLFDEADLLVVPSLWPEPFGLIGLEAAARGVPSAAFDVGGIGEWLHDGVNGRLAPARPPRAAALARAIVSCLRDPETHADLCRGALRIAAAHSMHAHATALLAVLASVTTAEIRETA